MLLIYSLPVSGALWAKTPVRGVVGKNITIDCHYEARYRSHTKFWCRGWTQSCSYVVETNGQHRRGRWSIIDNPTQGIFTVTVEDFHSNDTGRYSCGINTFGFDPMFNVQLQVSDEPEPNPGSSTTTTVAFTSTTNVTSENNDHAPSFSNSYMIWNVGRWLYFALLGICSISVSLFTSIRKGPNEPKPHSLP